MRSISTLGARGQSIFSAVSPQGNKAAPRKRRAINYCFRNRSLQAVPGTLGEFWLAKLGFK